MVEVAIAGRAIWVKTVETYSTPEAVAASEVAAQHARSRGWIMRVTSVAFDFDIYCDRAAELRAYVEDRKLQGAEIPYEELEERRRELGDRARLRCRRPWTLSSYRAGQS